MSKRVNETDSSRRLEHIREKQKRRRLLLAKQLGVNSADKLHTVLSSSIEQEEKLAAKSSRTPASSSSQDELQKKPPVPKNQKEDLQRKLQKSTVKDTADEDSREVYKDSSTFLKGTQSLNPHNDYCQNYVDTGQRPQNYIRDVGLADRFEEYPKLKDLIYLKDELIRKTNTPPMYLRSDLEHFDLRDLGSKFEVILIQPPLEEYQRQVGHPSDGRKSFSWEDIMALEIEEIAAPRSFVFLWCGSSDGLDYGRQCLKKWGFRRCEDICWIKTNFKRRVAKSVDGASLFVRTKEHTLMGIKGTVRRSTDGDFIHANVDIDLIIDEEQELGNEDKPEEIFHLIEHFCLSRRRLHLFGGDSSIRPGWLTVGPGLTNSNFDAETYRNYFKPTENRIHTHLTGCTDEIERLRPKTPPPRDKKGGIQHNPAARSMRGASNAGYHDLHTPRPPHMESGHHLTRDTLPPHAAELSGLPGSSVQDPAHFQNSRTHHPFKIRKRYDRQWRDDDR